MRKRITAWTLMAAAGILAACAPEVLPTKPHAALDMAQVKIYQTEPAKYEKLGMITLKVPSTEHWEQTADATNGMDELRKQAAARGANGVLLIDGEHLEYRMAGVLYGGSQYLVPLRKDPLTIAAQAIYVHQE